MIGNTTVHRMTFRVCGCLAFTLLALSLSGSTIMAQTAARPDRGISLNGSYSVSDIETVNLTNGNLNLSIPLASLPPIAGGKLSFGVYAVYNSKLWNVVRRQVLQREPPQPPSRDYVEDVVQLSDRGGWGIPIGYKLIRRDAAADFNWVAPIQGEEDWDILNRNPNWGRFYFITPDGAEHELKPVGVASYPGTREYLRGSYSATEQSGPLRLYSIDGSYIWAELNPSNDPSGIAWEAYLPDGTRIYNRNDGVERIQDTNGNSIKLITSDNNGTITSRINDEQTNREIKIAQTPALTGLDTRISYQAAGGTWVSIDVNFARTLVYGKTFETSVPTSAGGGSGSCTLPVTLGLGVSMDVVKEILLPQTEPGVQRKFSFKYSSDGPAVDVNLDWYGSCTSPANHITKASPGWGAVSEMKLPSGATANYSYSMSSTHAVVDVNDITRERIIAKTLTHDGTSDDWIYGRGDIHAPDGSVTTEYAYPTDSAFPGYYGGRQGLNGLVYKTDYSGKRIVERRWVCKKFNGGDDGVPSFGVGQFNPVVTEEYTKLVGNPSKMSAKLFQYDYNGNITQERDYDWFDPSLVTRDPDAINLPQGVPASATLLRVINNSYYNDATDTNSPNIYAKRVIGASPTPLILNALKETINDPSDTQFSYDDQPYGTAPTKGRVTTEAHWDDTAARWLNTKSTYDSYGNRISTRDPNDNVTTLTYDSLTHAQPTSVKVDPLNGTGPQTSSTVYDYWTGLITSTTDPNQNTASNDYTNKLLGTVDPFGRPGVVIDFQGRKSVNRFFDSTQQLEVWADLNSSDDALLKTRMSSDQLGRTVKTESSEDGATYTISTENQYQQEGRITITTNPMRGPGASTDGWTRTTRDDLGRMVLVEMFSGRFPSETSVGAVSTSYDANATTVTDQAGKVRRGLTDGLQRLVRADEPDSSGVLGEVNIPKKPTYYSYDSLGNLTKVLQGDQTPRSFIYDALSRLKEARNNESGTVIYTYDDNGNLKTKKDACGTLTTISYDGLNRVTDRLYSGPAPGGTTPRVTFSYDDSSVPNSKGRLTAVISSVSTYNYGSYDGMGRVLTGTQTTDGKIYAMSYQYNLAGGMTSETYPSNKVVVTEYDTAARIAGVKKDATTYYAGGAANSADAMTYAAPGAATTMKLGNGKWEHTKFNSLMQEEQIGVGASSTDSTILRLDFGYGGTSNTGNLLSQRIVIAGAGGMDVTQNYTYDSLNRLGTATEARTADGAQQWIQTYDIDRYGNRAVRTNSFMPNSALTPQSDSATDFSAFDQTNNRLSQTKFPNVVYDNAGNLKRDQVGSTFTYDAENHEITFNAPAVQYFYDGIGHRVKKLDSSGATVFVYDVGGRLIAEYTSGEPSASRTSYLTSDHLGSTRVVTDVAGNVKARYDYLPFGEEIPSTIGSRAGVPGYGGADSTRQKFTAKERDTESGLDYFGARYYSSATGRFLSVDAIAASSMHVVNPQRWNGYTYVCNNPLARTDVKGYWMFWQHDKLTRYAYARAQEKNSSIKYNENVNLANQRTDTHGQPFDSVYAKGGLHQEDHEPQLQRNHFLRSSGESQTTAYQNAIGKFEQLANMAQFQLSKGLNTDLSIGNILHLIQDAFAHTERNQLGEIKNIQCYNCGSDKDHQHPDFENKDGSLTVPANLAANASADFLVLIQNAGNLTQYEFETALKQFEQKYFKRAKPENDANRAQ